MNGQPCPGGPVAEYDDERMVGVCPECGIVVHTLFPGGVLPPHLVNRETGTVTFTPERIPPSHESDDPGGRGSQ